MGMSSANRVPGTPPRFTLSTHFRVALGVVDMSLQTSKGLRRRAKDIAEGQTPASGVVIFTATAYPVTADKACGIA